MGRKKKIIPNSTETPESVFTPATEVEQISGETKETIENKIDEIVSGFSSEAQPQEQSISPSVDDFQPRKRGPKKKVIEETPKPILKVPGKLFLKIHSKVAIGAVSFLDRFIDKANPIPEDYLHAIGLQEDDLSDPELVLMAEAAIKEMKLEDSPIAVFYASFGSMILTNYLTLKQFLKNEARKRKEAIAAEIHAGKKEMKQRRKNAR